MGDRSGNRLIKKARAPRKASNRSKPISNIPALNSEPGLNIAEQSIEVIQTFSTSNAPPYPKSIITQKSLIDANENPENVVFNHVDPNNCMVVEQIDTTYYHFCEICWIYFSKQSDFFLHLQSHYSGIEIIDSGTEDIGTSDDREPDGIINIPTLVEGTYNDVGQTYEQQDSLVTFQEGEIIFIPVETADTNANSENIFVVNAQSDFHGNISAEAIEVGQIDQAADDELEQITDECDNFNESDNFDGVSMEINILQPEDNKDVGTIEPKNKPTRKIPTPPIIPPEASKLKYDEFIDTPIDGTQPMKLYKCRLCDKVTKTKNIMLYHFLNHTGERPYKCDHCDKRFFAKSALTVHVRVHTGDKPYACKLCDLTFRQYGDLKYHHVSMHSEQKNHQCEFCGKNFSRRYSLVIHLRIHTGERIHQCEFCDKTFRASTYLQNHRRIHTGERRYPCHLCGKKFRVSGDLTRHKRTHKKKETRAIDFARDADVVGPIAVEPTLEEEFDMSGKLIMDFDEDN